MNTNPGLWSVIRRTALKEKAKGFALVITAAGSIYFSLLGPIVLEKVINDLVQGKTITFAPAVLYFALLALSGLFDSAREVLVTVFGQKITHGLRREMCQKLDRLPAQYFTNHASGMTVSRFVNDVDTVEALFNSGIISMFVDICRVIAILYVIFTRSLGLGILLLLLLPVLFVLTRFFQKWMISAQLANRKAIARVNNHVPETIKNIRMIHATHKQAYMEKRYDTYITESYQAVEKTNLYDSIYSPIIIVLSVCVISVMMILASMNGEIRSFFGMSVGTAVAVIAYVGKVFGPIEEIGMEIQNIQSAAAGVRRIREFLDEPEMEDKTESFSEKEENDHWFDNTNRPIIEFQNVRFGYEKDKPVLQDFNCKIFQGDNVLLTGRTGAGKSTAFRLLLGLYQPNEGIIMVMGKDACNIPDNQKRKVFGYVEQSVLLVSGTIAEQISLFDPELTREQIEAAAQTAGLHKMISNLPQGYDTKAQSRFFSQGQLQLLAIARAIAADPPILLLDEITANLDSATERTILDALRRASKERTIVSISHRFLEEQNNAKIINI